MTDFRNPASPRVNINGTDAQSLFDQQNDIVRATRALYDALAKAAPHGRDYQTCDRAFFHIARRDHADACRKVEGIQLAAEAKCLDIYDQADRKIKVTSV